MAARILAIDDDQDTLELYRVALEAEGYQVDLSSLPFEDIREVVRLQPDLILLDARMERANDGLHLLEKLRQHPSTRHIPLILCTAAPQVKEKHGDMFGQSGVSVIEKPFDLEDLFHTIQHRLASPV